MKHLDYHWHLRAKMAAQGMFATTDLQPHLAERGITLSREQVYRLVTGHPRRMSMDTLIALCDILDCTPNDLIEPAITETATATKAAAAGRRAIRATAPRRRTTITRPTETPE